MDSAPNRDDSVRTRTDNAKAFLAANPDERIAHAAQMFGLPEGTLYSAVSRNRKPHIGAKQGGHNKTLEHHVKAIHKYIRDLLAYGIPPSH